MREVLILKVPSVPSSVRLIVPNPDENTLDNICQNYDYDELGEYSNLIVIVCGTEGL